MGWHADASPFFIPDSGFCSGPGGPHPPRDELLGFHGKEQHQRGGQGEQPFAGAQRGRAEDAVHGAPVGVDEL